VILVILLNAVFTAAGLFIATGPNGSNGFDDRAGFIFTTAERSLA